TEAKNLQAPVELVRFVAQNGRLPVVTFTAGGIATPADAALCMQLGADGVFVGSGIFKSSDPSTRAKAIVEATTHFRDAEILASGRSATEAQPHVHDVHSSSSRRDRSRAIDVARTAATSAAAATTPAEPRWCAKACRSAAFSARPACSSPTDVATER